MSEIRDLDKQINFNNLICYIKWEDRTPINFIGFKDPLRLYENTFNGDTHLGKAEKDQKQFKSNLNEITRGNPKNKSRN